MIDLQDGSILFADQKYENRVYFRLRVNRRTVMDMVCDAKRHRLITISDTENVVCQVLVVACEIMKKSLYYGFC